MIADVAQGERRMIGAVLRCYHTKAPGLYVRRQDGEFCMRTGSYQLGFEVGIHAIRSRIPPHRVERELEVSVDVRRGRELSGRRIEESPQEFQLGERRRTALGNHDLDLPKSNRFPRQVGNIPRDVNGFATNVHVLVCFQREIALLDDSSQ